MEETDRALSQMGWIGARVAEATAHVEAMEFEK